MTSYLRHTIQVLSKNTIFTYNLIAGLQLWTTCAYLTSLLVPLFYLLDHDETKKISQRTR